MPLLWISFAFLLGLVFSSSLSVPWLIWLGMAALCLGLIFLEKKLRGEFEILQRFKSFCFVPVSLLLLFFFLGAARYGVARPHVGEVDLAYYNDSAECTLVAVVVDYPDMRDRSILLTLEAQQIEPDGQADREVQGKLLVKLPPGGDWQYGDQLLLSGVLQTPPEDEGFSYKEYLARQGIYSYMVYPQVVHLASDQGSFFMRQIYALRERAYTLINQFYAAPESALLSGILLGIDNDFPADLERAFQNTGTAHIIAISGFNISILIVLFCTIVQRIIPRIWSPVLAILLVFAYTILVGAEPAVMRAALMGSMALIGRQIGRKNSGVNSLLFTAALMNLVDPNLLWSVGFQLSFMAVLGILFYLDPMLEWVEDKLARFVSQDWVKWLAGLIGEYILVTIAAQITTLPLSVYYFESLSLSSFLINILVLPIQSLLMILGGVSVLLGLIWPVLGQLLAVPAWPLAALTHHIIEWGAGLPGGVFVAGNLSLALLILYYITLFSRELIPGFKEFMGKQRSATVLLGLGLAAAFVWQIAFRAPDEYLRVFVMNVPDGPALYLVAPGGQQVLLNGSSSSNQLSDQLGRQQPLNKRRLDAVFLLSENSKYLKGLPRTLDRFPVDLLVRDPALLREDDARLLEEAQFRDGLRVLDLQTGEIFWLDTDISLKVILHYQGNAAVVLNWKNFQLLMPNGIPPDMLQRYAQSDLRSVDVLILTDADSQSQDDWNILDSVLITTPLPCMVEENAQWISYEEIDWINLRTDGEWMWLETDRLISE